MGAVIMGLVTGAVFGAILFKAGAIRSDRVIGMLTLRDTKIMKWAFTTIAVVALGYGLADLAGVAERWALVPRVLPYMRGAHLVGGVIFGVAMGFSGYCPGTVACRAGGRRGWTRLNALWAVAGLFVGVGIYHLVYGPLQASGIIAEQKLLTVQGVLGLPFGPVAVVAGVLFLLLSAGLDRLTPEAPAEAVAGEGVVDRLRREWPWLPSGVLAGLTILWATHQGGHLGYSGSLLAAYSVVANAIGSPSEIVPSINAGILWHAALIVGAFAGGITAAALSLRPQTVAPDRAQVGAGFAALSAGTGLGLGAMIGGGCTTGAFLSGFPTLSLGSLAMGGVFFAAGVATATLRSGMQNRAASRARVRAETVS